MTMHHNTMLDCYNTVCQIVYAGLASLLGSVPVSSSRRDKTAASWSPGASLDHRRNDYPRLAASQTRRSGRVRLEHTSADPPAFLLPDLDRSYRRAPIPAIRAIRPDLAVRAIRFRLPISPRRDVTSIPRRTIFPRTARHHLPAPARPEPAFCRQPHTAPNHSCILGDRRRIALIEVDHSPRWPPLPLLVLGRTGAAGRRTRCRRGALRSDTARRGPLEALRRRRRRGVVVSLGLRLGLRWGIFWARAALPAVRGCAHRVVDMSLTHSLRFDLI